MTHTNTYTLNFLCRFVTGIIDALNAEIALGTVGNVDDAVTWVGYTYLMVRMRKNPFQYGEKYFCINTMTLAHSTNVQGLAGMKSKMTLNFLANDVS